ncbi:hypoxanthine phosphoribosyltransferase [Brachyspira aalborgi]|jgi:hypoxanthine phosphoribosyltransferase|uniref:Hypoxanthine phosphoribosyltransferase n=1 Tax=Brachyspira aalborgi TaxID=29522 RepID=A0AB38Q122_9SPIR|nr:hypoxanthine phosphoribosyltransferase [Brachyspira aalborgi]TXJ14179.1 hypoxanthine phosphoribosyltransferase [Brachyspira aalborgi]TXJ18876.1 hypoxanthine phosphoribosyltransferase [Brachyspira aalborgi]TXJ25638.1 hypoxanthine phosphoribosyltransferase [Brachyspira aalborgi]TXJ32572.1 hypoxanthine phosphoribosyltransferase [Brachyspira aalborgi]TXJ42049.1 hypoxanthine phosphoribosyltransferase [Brachyspira aalborgi]
MNKERGISKILIEEKQINEKVKELAKRISDDYRNKENIPCLIGLLKGSFIFIADLSRYIDIPIEIDFMIVSSYGNNQIGSEIKILKDIDVQLSGRDVIIVEDIIDTGYTLEKICEVLQTRNIASLKICALLNKPSRRKVNINIDYNGFNIEDEFVVGYGIDYAQKYRNLNYIGVVE